MNSMSSLKCPHCGAPLPPVQENVDVICSYCGSRVKITNENEYIFRTIDEAEVQRTKSERDIKLKELDLQFLKEKSDNEFLKYYNVVWAAIIAVLLIAGFFGIENAFSYAITAAILGFFGKFAYKAVSKIYLESKEVDNFKREKINSGYIKVPTEIGLAEYKTINVDVAVRILQSAGFKNIELISLKDLHNTIRKKPGDVGAVVINGTTLLLSNDLFPPDAKVVIKYHDMRKPPFYSCAN